MGAQSKWLSPFLICEVEGVLQKVPFSLTFALLLTSIVPLLRGEKNYIDLFAFLLFIAYICINTNTNN